MKTAAVFVMAAFLLQPTGHPLSSAHKKWLEEEVVYLISPEEKEVFLKLDTDRLRDHFIQAFWNHRDPTPGTPENEARQEHYRRLQYAKNYLRGGTAKIYK